VTLIKDFLCINVEQFLYIKLNIFNLLDDHLSFCLPRNFDLLFQKFVFPAAEEDNYVEPWLLGEDDVSHGLNEFDQPHKDKEDIESHNSEQECVLDFLGHVEICRWVITWIVF
jgi:hypothetical protein